MTNDGPPQTPEGNASLLALAALFLALASPSACAIAWQASDLWPPSADLPVDALALLAYLCAPAALVLSIAALKNRRHLPRLATLAALLALAMSALESGMMALLILGAALD
jgi:hypothetical protein